MKKIRSFIIAGALCLSGCSTTPSADTVDTINTLTVPVLHSDAQLSGQSAQAVVSCFQDNSAIIGSLSRSLKNNYLQDASKKDIFDKDSEAFHVYSALTKLEQMSAMNEVYRKENNIAGLQVINRLLKAVPVAA